MSKRTEMVASSLQRAISKIVQNEIKDPRLGMVTITTVKVSRDLKNATVYASALGNENEVKTSMKTLKKSLGFIKNRIKNYMKIRYIPDINIVLDDTARNAQRMETIIKEFHSEDDPVDPDSDS